MKIKIKKVDPEAIVPTQATKFDAGYDLYSLDYGWIRPNERRLIHTGISIAIPEGYYGRIAPRSGLAWKDGIDVLAGVIDSSYRGKIGVILYNTNGGDEMNTVKIEKGQKIAQLIIEKCHEVEWELVDSLDETQRGAGGFGSSGS
jgi:dUTP pyrophosphatase